VGGAEEQCGRDGPKRTKYPLDLSLFCCIAKRVRVVVSAFVAALLEVLPQDFQFHVGALLFECSLLGPQFFDGFHEFNLTGGP
jgi:hypothetical protein